MNGEIAAGRLARDEVERPPEIATVVGSSIGDGVSMMSAAMTRMPAAVRRRRTGVCNPSVSFCMPTSRPLSQRTRSKPLELDAGRRNRDGDGRPSGQADARDAGGMRDVGDAIAGDGETRNALERHAQGRAEPAGARRHGKNRLPISSRTKTVSPSPTSTSAKRAGPNDFGSGHEASGRPEINCTRCRHETGHHSQKTARASAIVEASSTRCWKRVEVLTRSWCN